MQTITTTFEVTDLKQWTYCPRIVYYRYCLPTVRPVTRSMNHGIDGHRAESGREERRSLRAYGLEHGERVFDLALHAEELGLRGRLDLAIAVPERNAPGAEAVVVEYKDSERKAGAHFKLQLAAYALLLEEAWSLPVRLGCIYHIPTRHVERIAITPALRAKVRATVAALRDAVDGEHMPAPPLNRSPCVGCEFRRFCNDVV